MECDITIQRLRESYLCRCRSIDKTSLSASGDMPQTAAVPAHLVAENANSRPCNQAAGAWLWSKLCPMAAGSLNDNELGTGKHATKSGLHATIVS